MECEEVLVNNIVTNGGGFLSRGSGLDQVNGENGLFRVGDDEIKKGNLEDEVLEDLEEYWEDIHDRLMISRMVSDSVIKGMVNAVQREAAEKIASKDLELANLKEYLRSHAVVDGRFEDANFSLIGNHGSFPCSPNPFVKHEKMREELCALRNLAREPFKKAQKEVKFARASNLMKKIGSGPELEGLGGILQEKQSESWMHVDETLEHLKETVEAVCKKVDDILLSSKTSLCEWQQERNLSENLEGIVIESVLRRHKEEFEENIWEQNTNAQFFGIQNVNWVGKFNEISNLCSQLDAIVKSLSISDMGLVSHGSHDLDHLHHNAFSNHVNPPTSIFGEIGALDASNIHVAENYDFQQLKHLSEVELVDYFNNIITKMKRDHESVVQQMTEEYFRLKREYLKERGSSLIHRKDEEFDVLRKKIPEVILKLEDFLSENKSFPALINNLESIEKLKHRLESLLSENRQLRECLTDKQNEVKCLEAQVSSAATKLLEHSLSEENMLKLIENLKSEAEDSRIGASLNEEVYKCALTEQIAQTRCNSDDLNMEPLIISEIYDIILHEAAIPSENANKYECEDSDIESLIMQGLSGFIFSEAAKDAGQKLNFLYQEVQIDKEIMMCLEIKALEKENELRLEVEKNEKLKQEIIDLGTEVNQKEKLAMDLSSSLSKEKGRFERASIELSNLREHASRQQILVTESNKELDLLKSQHLEVLDDIKVGKMEMNKLNQILDQTEEELEKADIERNTAFSLAQEMHDKLLSSEARAEKLKKEMKMSVSWLSKMLLDFQCRASEAIKKNSFRLEGMGFHLKDLVRMANTLRSTGLMYKQKLERRSADLQLAEAEVDLLGDEVDAMLRLLEKIYIALDHYSPVLKHYPGIIEILELIRREMSGESTALS